VAASPVTPTTTTGLCTDCLKEVRQGEGDPPQQEPDRPDGVDTYEF